MTTGDVPADRSASGPEADAYPRDHSAADLLAAGRYLALKYAFENEEPRRRIVTLTTEYEGSSAPQPAAIVARALDPEAIRRQWVRPDRVGTRHRSAYRFCQVARDAVVVVVSRDGGLRFVRWHDDAVTYWDQVATGPWEV